MSLGGRVTPVINAAVVRTRPRPSCGAQPSVATHGPDPRSGRATGDERDGNERRDGRAPEVSRGPGLGPDGGLATRWRPAPGPTKAHGALTGPVRRAAAECHKQPPCLRQSSRSDRRTASRGPTRTPLISGLDRRTSRAYSSAATSSGACSALITRSRCAGSSTWPRIQCAPSWRAVPSCSGRDSDDLMIVKG